MPYVSGFVGAVPTANKEAYIAHARQAWTLFEKIRRARNMRMLGGRGSGWRSDVFPDGGEGAARRDRGLSPGSSGPTRATAQACMASMETDPAWSALTGMPFDGKRMIFGDFEPIMVARRT